MNFISTRAVVDRRRSSVAARLRARSTERGATAVEYGLMVAFIALAIVATVVILGTKVTALFVIPAGVL